MIDIRGKIFVREKPLLEAVRKIADPLNRPVLERVHRRVDIGIKLEL